MAFIPEDARWYLADVVLEYRIEGDPHNLVHINIHLVEADSPEQAYDKAVELGRDAAFDYENSEGRQVRVRFRGLRDLNVIHDSLEDGAELTYESLVDISEERLAAWTHSREDLSVFRPGEGRPEASRPNILPVEFGFLDQDSSRIRRRVLSREGFLGRLRDAKCVNCEYRRDEVAGMISAWQSDDDFILTWEECPPGEQYDESTFTRDERHKFATPEAVLAFVERAGFSHSDFHP